MTNMYRFEGVYRSYTDKDYVKDTVTGTYMLASSSKGADEMAAKLNAVQLVLNQNLILQGFVKMDNAPAPKDKIIELPFNKAEAGRGMSRQFENGLDRLIEMHAGSYDYFSISVTDTLTAQRMTVIFNTKGALALKNLLNEPYVVSGLHQTYTLGNGINLLEVEKAREGFSLLIKSRRNNCSSVCAFIQKECVTAFKIYLGELIASVNSDYMDEVKLDLDVELGLHEHHDPLWMEGFHAAQLVAGLSVQQQATLKALSSNYQFSVRRSHDNKMLLLIMLGTGYPQIVMPDGKIQDFGPWMLRREVTL